MSANDFDLAALDAPSIVYNPPSPIELGTILGTNIPSRLRASAAQLAVGIAEAGEEGRIKAWRNNRGGRDFDPAEQPGGSYLTCCPAHDDHNPSFVATDGIDENGKPKLLIYCRAGCEQAELIAALDELGLWNCTPEIIDHLKAMTGDSAADVSKKPAKRKSEAIVPAPANAPPPPDYHSHLGPMTRRWEYRNAAGELVCYTCRFDPNPTWEKNFANAPKGKFEKPDQKTFRPQSFCRYEDYSMCWVWVAPPKSDIPLYNADKLAANPAANVIVCEGEKAVDSAQQLYPECVAVTWFGGAKAVAKAPWKKLASRKVLVWPDYDEAGSVAAQAVVNELRLVGCTSIAMLDVKALASIDPMNPDGAKRDPQTKWDAADALSEWADPVRLREAVAQNSRRLEVRGRVELSPDNIGETVDKSEEELRNSSLPVFNRAGFIIRAGHYWEKFADGRTQQVLIAQTLSAPGLGEVLESIISFEQYDARMKKMKPVHAPDLLLRTFLERGKLSGLKPLTGLTDIPLVRRDGSLLDAPGYDPATGIYHQPSALALNIPEEPTLDDAKEAIGTLKHLIRDFPFESDLDMAAAISAFISAVNRPTLGATPMHAFSAPNAGSGKSLLQTVVTIVATGSEPSFITQGPDEEELEKRISTQMLEGRQVINLDNCNRPLRGAALCNLLTAEKVSLRILGRSQAPEITSSSFIMVNGNNLRLADDIVRRAVICEIDPKMERPEERLIDWDAKAEARKNRGKYVSACITIMLAYQAAGAPKQTTPLGSFENWSRRVRDAIIWAGLPDPCSNADKLRDADPDRERFLEIVDQWNKHFGNDWKKVAEVITVANSTSSQHQNSELKVSLLNVADAGRDISANRLAAFLSRYVGRPIEGFKFVSRKGRAGTKQWRLEKSATVTPHSPASTAASARAPNSIDTT